MARSSKPQEDDSGGAPEWMVTFCDCMTLLLTFFVLLLSFATFNKETLPELGLSFAEALPSIGLTPSERRESVWQKLSSEETVNQTEGSETPTQAKQKTSNYMREKRPLDFRNLKVFCAPSETFFFGQGAALSGPGRQTLEAMAVFLEHQTGRVVISENGPEGNTDLGLLRGAAVMNYLVQKGLDKSRFSLAAESTMRDKSLRRQIEITLLDRSLYE